MWSTLYTLRNILRYIHIMGPVLSELHHPQHSRSHYHRHGHVQYAPRAKRVWCCTCTRRDTCNEIDLGLMAPVLAQLQPPNIPQATFQEPLLRPWPRQYGPIEQNIITLHINRHRRFHGLHYDWMGPVVSELWGGGGGGWTRDGHTDGQRDGRTAFCIPFFFPWERAAGKNIIHTHNASYQHYISPIIEI